MIVLYLNYYLTNRKCDGHVLVFMVGVYMNSAERQIFPSIPLPRAAYLLKENPCKGTGRSGKLVIH